MTVNQDKKVRGDLRTRRGRQRYQPPELLAFDPSLRELECLHGLSAKGCSTGGTPGGDCVNGGSDSKCANGGNASNSCGQGYHH